jgi:uncharacterized repeat protein (TIGR01451 family)
MRGAHRWIAPLVALGAATGGLLYTALPVNANMVRAGQVAQAGPAEPGDSQSPQDAASPAATVSDVALESGAPAVLASDSASASPAASDPVSPSDAAPPSESASGPASAAASDSAPGSGTPSDSPSASPQADASPSASDAASSPAPGQGSAPVQQGTDGRDWCHLKIVKTADRDHYLPGGMVTYTITLTNEGNQMITGAVVTDDLGGDLQDGVYNDDAHVGTGTLSYAPPVLTWVGDLKPGDSTQIVYTVTANNPDNGPKHLRDAVTGPGFSNCPTGTEEGCHLDLGSPSLTVSKEADRKEAKPGELVTYTVRFTNSGSERFPDGELPVITDDLGQVLHHSTFVAGSLTSTVPSATFDPMAGTITWTGQLAAGAEGSFTYQVQVDDPYSGERFLHNTIVSPQSTDCQEGSTDVRCTAQVEIRVVDRTPPPTRVPSPNPNPNPPPNPIPTPAAPPVPVPVLPATHEPHQGHHLAHTGTEGTAVLAGSALALLLGGGGLLLLTRRLRRRRY